MLLGVVEHFNIIKSDVSVVMSVELVKCLVDKSQSERIQFTSNSENEFIEVNSTISVLIEVLKQGFAIVLAKSGAEVSQSVIELIRV
jgi:hypothetical protein